MSNTEIMAAFLGMGMISMVVCLAVCVVVIIGTWKIFEKAGEAGWKSIIPVYNMYIEFKICWETKYFWITLGLILVGGVLEGLAGTGSSANTILIMVGSLVELAGLIIALISTYYLSKSFGHGAGWFIGLLCLSCIFTCMLGFGSSQYIGPKGERC